jgi:predicted transcriptional regulator of viral defense system
MAERGTLSRLMPGYHCYQVTLPYADRVPVDEAEILGELNPYAALSHQSALAYHGLTDDLPTVITALVPRDGLADLLPPGTTSDDWEGLTLPPSGRPATIRERPVRWTTTKRERFFGVALYQRQGFPQRVTDRERTLLDALVEPDLSGGVQNVLAAWARARDFLALDSLVEYTERFDIGLLQQRVGFLLEEFGLTHPALARWQERAQRSGRGGSSKLVSAAPYGAAYSARWNLALNAPLGPLRDDA